MRSTRDSICMWTHLNDHVGGTNAIAVSFDVVSNTRQHLNQLHQNVEHMNRQMGGASQTLCNAAYHQLYRSVSVDAVKNATRHALCFQTHAQQIHRPHLHILNQLHWTFLAPLLS